MNGFNEPLVSIIVNCYNSDEFLKETLESVLCQTYSNWELVFWDNQSKDRSAEYLKSYQEPRFNYYYAPSHTPLSASRNFAIEKAKGTYLAFLDCDDLWMCDKLELQINEIKKDNTIGFVYTLFDLLFKEQHPSIDQQLKYYKSILIQGHPAKNLFFELLQQNKIIFSSVLIKKSIFDQTGGFNPIFHQNEDYEILLKACLYGKASCIDRALVKYRIHINNNSHKNGERNFFENEIIFKSLPISKEVDQAIARNKVRHILYRAIYQKKYLSIIRLFEPKLMINLFQILKKRLVASV